MKRPRESYLPRWANILLELIREVEEELTREGRQRAKADSRVIARGAKAS